MDQTVIVIRPSWVYNPLIRRGWQHDGRNPHNPHEPPLMPQKVPEASQPGPRA
ncbi:hypothetical protein KDL29_10240 [bacterium]|nr:hypothetical protein [bacterium]